MPKRPRAGAARDHVRVAACSANLLGYPVAAFFEDPGWTGGKIQAWPSQPAARHKQAQLQREEHTQALRVCDPLRER